MHSTGHFIHEYIHRQIGIPAHTKIHISHNTIDDSMLVTLGNIDVVIEPKDSRKVIIEKLDDLVMMYINDTEDNDDA